MKANTKPSLTSGREEHPPTEVLRKEKSPSQQIDAIIKGQSDWRGKKLSQLRAVIKKADPAVVEEVKWKKPSKPSGVPVWSHGGIICVADTLKNAVRLTFPKGAQVKDPKKLFNTRLDSDTVRAIDFYESEAVDEAALKALIIEAVEVEKAGLKVTLKKTADYKIPKELQNKLDENMVLKEAFYALTPGRQRGYIYYFSQPKLSKTREARVEKSIDRILDGMGIND